MDGKSPESYVLGDGAAEMKRLEVQAKFYYPQTRSLFVAAGIGAGQRVLDFGCGAGDTGMLAAELVGPGGAVTSLDRSAAALEMARARVGRRGFTNIEFLLGDESLIGTDTLPEESFDAVVGRFVMMHQRDPVATLRQLARALKPSGVVAFDEVNIGSGGACIPSLPLFELTWNRIRGAARHANVDLQMGIKMPGFCRAAGLKDVEAGWRGRLMPAADRGIFECMQGMASGLLPVMERFGVATAEEVGVSTLADRLQAEAIAADATLTYSFNVCVWARKA